MDREVMLREGDWSMMKIDNMPVVCPLPICTEDARYWKALYIWLFTTRRWVLEEDWEYKLNSWVSIYIPKGFIFDGASVPRIFWFLFSPIGILFIPGLVHDFAYKYTYVYLKIGIKGKLVEHRGESRDYWDRIFKTIAIRVNGFKLINQAAYLVLKGFGWVAWNNHRRNDDVEA